MTNQAGRFIARLSSVAGLSLMLGSSLVVAQDSARELAKIPFAFHARETNLPAGNYVVHALSSQGVLQIADAKTGHSILVGTRAGQSNRNDMPMLKFHRYGHEYFLSEIRMPGRANGYSVGMSVREKELARQPGQLAFANVYFESE